MTERDTKASYEVVNAGRGYGIKWWDVKLPQAPDRAETQEIANTLDGGFLFGSRCEGGSNGVYRIVGYID